MNVKALKRIRVYYSWKWVKEAESFQVFDHKKRKTFFKGNTERIIIEYLFDYVGMFTAMRYQKDRVARQRLAQYNKSLKQTSNL